MGKLMKCFFKVKGKLCFLLGLYILPQAFVSQLLAGTNPYQVPVIKSKNDYAKTVYIDPTGSNGDGSIDNPFNSWGNAIKTENTAYLFKAGTVNEEEVSTSVNNIYIGRYGAGDNPIIRRLAVSSDFLTVSSLDIIYEGFVWQIVYLNENSIPKNTTISNCLIKGVNTGDGYPHRNIQGRCDGLTLFHNEICYSHDDGFYSPHSPNTTMVSNYFHHNNMGGVVDINCAGDGIQFEHAEADNSYIANNFIDRQHSIWKFALIVNATSATQSNFVCEWNTFISPRMGNGGSAVFWYAGASNIFRKNLMNTNDGIPGIHGGIEYLNQEAPNGVRDNHEFGPGRICNQSLADPSNLDFNTFEEYQAYLELNGLTIYGSDIDTANFWGPKELTVCDQNPITINENIGNDTNNLGNGYIELVSGGGYGNLEYSWSSGENTGDIYSKYADKYTVTVTDDSLCSVSRTFQINNIDYYYPVNPNGIKLSIARVHVTNNDGNEQQNMLDGDFETRWSSNEESVIAITVLEEKYLVKSMRLAFFRGTERQTFFQLYTSSDSLNWESHYDGASSGLTTGFEHFEIVPVEAKYVKIVGLGNDMPGSEAWTSITEFETWGEEIDTWEEEVETIPDTIDVQEDPEDDVGIDVTTEVYDNYDKNNGPVVYPNPVYDNFFLDLKGQSIVRIYDKLGNLRYGGVFPEGTSNVVINLKPGIYAVNIENVYTGKTTTKKILVK